MFGITDSQYYNIRKFAPILGLVVFVCLGVVWVSMMPSGGGAFWACDRSTRLSGDPGDMWRRGGSPRKRIMLAFKHALYRYENDTGTLPYDPAGGVPALVMLAKWVDTDEYPRLRILDQYALDYEVKGNESVPIDYLNPRNTSRSNLDPMTIILAESTVDSRGGKWIMLADGVLEYVKGGDIGVGDLCHSPKGDVLDKRLENE